MNHRKRRPGKTTVFTKRWKVEGLTRDSRLRPSEIRRLGIKAPRLD